MIKKVLFYALAICYAYPQLIPMSRIPYYQNLALAVTDGDAVEVGNILNKLTKYSDGKIDQTIASMCTEFFFIAIKTNKFGVVQAFLRYGIDVNVREYTTGNTALHLAVLYSDVRMLWVLVQAKELDFSSCNLAYKTALDLAVDQRNELKVSFLREACASQSSGKPINFKNLLADQRKEQGSNFNWRRARL